MTEVYFILKVQSGEQQGEIKILTKCTHFNAMQSSPCWRNAALVWIHDCLYCISGEQALITKTTFNWACVYKMLPSCSSFTYQNKWVLWRIFFSNYYMHCFLYVNRWITFCLDEIRCVKNNVCLTIMCGTSSAAVIDIYYFSAQTGYGSLEVRRVFLDKQTSLRALICLSLIENCLCWTLSALSQGNLVKCLSGLRVKCTSRCLVRRGKSF